MFIVNVILAVVLGASFILSGVAKLTKQTKPEEGRVHLGVDSGLWTAIGVLDVLGGVGVLIGLHADLPVIGVLAAVGLVAMTIGAVFYHQKAGDAMKDWLPAVVMGSIAIFYIIFRVGTA